MYYIVYGSIWLLSFIPFRVFYIIADFIYFLMFYVFKYRKDIVMNNLQIAFPEKTKKERIEIAKSFYKNLVDTLCESIKCISISKKQIHKRNSGGFEEINQLAAKGYSIHIMAGHQFNWEYLNLHYALNLKIPYIAVYGPLKNKVMNRLFLNLRTKFGTNMVSSKEFKNKKEELFSEQYSIVLAADQNPGYPANAYWLNFFGKPAPFLKGPALGAVKKDVAFVVLGSTKVKRGYYTYHTTVITEKSTRHTPEELTVRFKNEMEKIIRHDPSNYLWSHRRWKYEWKPEFGEMIIERAST